MSNKFLIATPIYNSYDILSQSKYPYKEQVFVDNASTDQSEAWLRKKDATYIQNPSNLGRIGNWEQCVRVAVQQNSYLKWLFAGDELVDEYQDLIQSAMSKFPNAALFVFQYDIEDESGHTKLWSMSESEQILSSEETLEWVVRDGNVFGGPISQLVSVDALASSPSFGDLSWVADFRFALEIAKTFDTVFIPKKIGTFSMRFRRTFRQLSTSVSSIMEEYLIRKKALEYLAPDEEKRKMLQYHMDRWFLKNVSRYYKKTYQKDLLEVCSSLPSVFQSILAKRV